LPRTLGFKKLTPEKKVSVALFLVVLTARATRAVNAVKKAMATFKLGSTVVWEVWRSRTDVGARKPKKTKRAKGKIARLVAGVLLCDRQTLESLANTTAVPKTTLWRHLKKRLASPCGFARETNPHIGTQGKLA
ncbi:hypothetical protein JG687_00015454, partial [Phytophthora cactorum]